MTQSKRFIAKFGVVFCLIAFTGALAAPPPWAPAHGYRHKNKHGDHAYHAAADFGILQGHCNREAVGAFLGGAVGGVVGSQIGEGSGRVLATVAGTVLGYILGSAIGRSMDEADRFCTGQVLEYAEDHHTVRWSNPVAHMDYWVTPIKRYRIGGQTCRDFITRYKVDKNIAEVTKTACRLPDGSWRIQP